MYNTHTHGVASSKTFTSTENKFQNRHCWITQSYECEFVTAIRSIIAIHHVSFSRAFPSARLIAGKVSQLGKIGKYSNPRIKRHFSAEICIIRIRVRISPVTKYNPLITECAGLFHPGYVVLYHYLETPAVLSPSLSSIICPLRISLLHNSFHLLEWKGNEREGRDTRLRSHVRYWN